MLAASLFWRGWLLGKPARWPPALALAPARAIKGLLKPTWIIPFLCFKPGRLHVTLIGLANKFTRVFPWQFMEKSGQTFWPAQYYKLLALPYKPLCHCLPDLVLPSPALLQRPAVSHSGSAFYLFSLLGMLLLDLPESLLVSRGSVTTSPLPATKLKSPSPISYLTWLPRFPCQLVPDIFCFFITVLLLSSH